MIAYARIEVARKRNAITNATVRDLLHFDCWISSLEEGMSGLDSSSGMSFGMM